MVFEQMADGYFVGVALGSSAYQLPSGAKHPTYPVWAEVTGTGSGSAIEYRKACQFSSRCLERVVRQCREP